MNRLFNLSKTRSLIRLSGSNSEASQFLQGLITNDINHLANKSPSCIYALFLNKAGRVLFDSIVYKTAETGEDRESFLIECDSTITENLLRHLKLYRVRKKIDLKVAEELNLWCYEGAKENLDKTSGNFVFHDPRLKDLGFRVITEKDEKLNEKLNVQNSSIEDYAVNRYSLGICEGVVDLLPEKSFPLESNCDYMHGVSFHKGCYIGQELTARTHHTGVIRKRLMPLFFDKNINFNTNEPATVKNEEGADVGKVRNIIGSTGLGLLRVEKVLEAKSLHVNENICRTEKPKWWPIEADKKTPLKK